MSMQWFKLWNRLIDSWKVQKLPADVFRAWINVLCIASRENNLGRLPGIETIAWSSRMDVGLATTYLDLLLQAGLIDIDEDGYQVHGWNKWQGPPEVSATALRMRRYRRRKGLKTSKVQPENYAEYLQSDHWQRLRKATLAAYFHRCAICNSNGETLDVHHRTYERLGAEQDPDVIALCRTCHDLFHQHGKLV